MSADLITRLRAALDAEAKAAHAAAAVCGCHPEAPSWEFGDDANDGRIVVVGDPHPGMKRKMGRRWNGSYEGLFTARHIAAHDPAFVLADITAKRKLLDMHAEFDFPHNPDDGPGDYAWTARCDACHEDTPCTTVRLLAEAYGIRA